MAAGVYAGRKKIDTLFIAKQIGGQSAVSDKIGNWIGEVEISGFELAQKLEGHLKSQEGVEIKIPEEAKKIEKKGKDFFVLTDKGKYLSRTVIICTGGRDRRLGVPGEDEFAGKGVAYCSTCDAPFFKNKKVVVVGAGNAGLEAVIDLRRYAQEIILLEAGSKIKGDQKTFEQVEKTSKAKVFLQTKIKEIRGHGVVTGIIIEDLATGKTAEIETDGVFVEVGVVPNSEIVKDLVDLNEKGEIAIKDPCTGATSVEGLYAAGDVTDEIYKQNNIAAGEGVKAILSVYKYLRAAKA